MDMFIEGANFLLNSLVEGVNALTDWLPDSPLQAPIAAIRSNIGSDMLGYVNYFLPITEILTILSGWVFAISLYYVVSLVLRWAKAIS